MAQDPHEVAELCRALEAAKGGKSKAKTGKKGFSCKKTTFPVAGTDGIAVDSWRFNDWDYKRDDLPTYARGLFTTKTSKNVPEICIRGYDKFFNVGEVRDTEWQNVEQHTQGPYELSVKENGCIIFMSGLEDGTLLVCSKHSTGARADVDQSHAVVGERWVKKHLERVGKTTQDLATELRNRNLTAVAELCDDEFEEHVLEYPPEMAGLYLHGLNFNLPEFETLSGPEVHEFADTWGFKKAQYIIIQTLDEVKSFLEKCGETGSWEGRDTEGFVVRCKWRARGSAVPVDWFFKYKFEEPYLMYRQWRECTKSIIAGKPPKFKKHKKITEEYLLYARQQLAKNPKLGKLYNQNHGIIAMRDGFLAHKGKKGSELIAQEQEDGEPKDEAVTRNVVLVPIASIGCGKTTIANALVRLFDFGHFQNDNVEGKSNRPARFVEGVVKQMSTHKVTIADRNNHQFRERQQLIEDISKIVHDAHFVALHYVHEPKNQLLDDIRRITRRRVLERGDNHQTIRTSKGESEIVGIMEGFLHRFQGYDPHREPDSNFDEVINLDVTASSLENLETVITHLYNVYPKALPEEMPSHEEMEEAIDFAMGATVDLKHDLSFGGSKKEKKQSEKSVANNARDSKQDLTPDQAIDRLEYFGATVSSTVITSTLASLFQKASPEESKMYNLLKQSRRIQNDFHVTLIHRASRETHSQLWEWYEATYRQALLDSAGQEKDRFNPSLGPARLRLERLVWNDRVMAIVVRILPVDHHPALESANDVPHITIGTANAGIKPKESNDLLARWMGDSHEGSRIYDKEVPGMKVLEGTVRAVLRR